MFDHGPKFRRRLPYLLAVMLLVVSGWVGIGPSKPAAASGVSATMSIGDASIVEGDSGTRSLYFAVTLSQPSTTAITVHYLVSTSGSATAGTCTQPGADFQDGGGRFGSLSFPLLATGQTATTKWIVVKVCSDVVQESDETFSVGLWDAPTGYSFLRANATGTIIDDDAVTAGAPSISIGNVGAGEGDVGSRSVKFAVTLNRPSTIPTSVDYSILSGTATCGTPTRAGTDCADGGGKTKTLAFPAGAIEKVVTEVVLPDKRLEADETYSIRLSNPVGLNMGRAIGTGTIYDDEPKCDGGLAAPAQYQHVVVFAFENRSWTDVGGPGFASPVMPYLGRLAQACSYFSSYSEVNPAQSSMTQYTGLITGSFQPQLINNCRPSVSCSTTADNIFRQVRLAGKTAINYVDGATSGCSAGTDFSATNQAWVQVVPTLYLSDPGDAAACNTQVRPYTEFDPNNLPTFAFISPNPCNNGHNLYTCGDNAHVDNWASANIDKVLQSPSYLSGQTAVFVWYDEDEPVPNLQISRSVHPGPLATSGIGYASTLAAWESMLGLPCLANACTTPDMRVPTGL